MLNTSQNIFSLERNLYTNGAPVVIESGVMVRNVETEELSARLTIRNISPKTIKSALVSILPFDNFGEPLGDVHEFRYDNVGAAYGSIFGENTSFMLPDSAASACSAIVSEVVFSDSTLWRDTGAIWESLLTI